MGVNRATRRPESEVREGFAYRGHRCTEEHRGNDGPEGRIGDASSCMAGPSLRSGFGPTCRSPMPVAIGHRGPTYEMSWTEPGASATGRCWGEVRWGSEQESIGRRPVTGFGRDKIRLAVGTAFRVSSQRSGTSRVGWPARR